MNEAGKRAARRAQEDAVFNKLLTWLGGLVCLELFTLLVKRFYIDFHANEAAIRFALGVDGFFGVFRFAGLAAVLACGAWLLVTLRAGKKAVAPLVCTAAVGWLWLAAILCYGLNEAGMTLLCAIPVVLGILCAIWFIYQREFFACACLGAVGIGAIWVLRGIYMGHPRLSWCVAVAVCVLMALCALLLRKVAVGGGKLGTLRIFSAKAHYAPVYLTCAVVALGMLAAMLLNVAAAGYYLLFVLVGWLFCLAVYYTVKMM